MKFDTLKLLQLLFYLFTTNTISFFSQFRIISVILGLEAVSPGIRSITSNTPVALQGCVSRYVTNLSIIFINSAYGSIFLFLPSPHIFYASFNIIYKVNSLRYKVPNNTWSNAIPSMQNKLNILLREKKLTRK